MKGRKVYSISDIGEVVTVYGSVKDAAFWCGITPSAIYRSIKGHCRAAGHFWQYLEPDKFTKLILQMNDAKFLKGLKLALTENCRGLKSIYFDDKEVVWVAIIENPSGADDRIIIKYPNLKDIILSCFGADREIGFSQLRRASLARLPKFKNLKGDPAHLEPDGSDWS